MLRLAAAFVHPKVVVRMGFFLDNHFANTSIFSFIALLAANIAKIAHFRFWLMYNYLACFEGSF